MSESSKEWRRISRGEGAIKTESWCWQREEKSGPYIFTWLWWWRLRNNIKFVYYIDLEFLTKIGANLTNSGECMRESVVQDKRNYECYFSKQNHLFGIYVNIQSESRLDVLEASSYVKGKGIFGMYEWRQNYARWREEVGEKVVFHFSCGWYLLNSLLLTCFWNLIENSSRNAWTEYERRQIFSLRCFLLCLFYFCLVVSLGSTVDTFKIACQRF